jgi:hypothetical protein
MQCNQAEGKITGSRSTTVGCKHSARNQFSLFSFCCFRSCGYLTTSRFLKQGSEQGHWESVAGDVAREKASQCLRNTVLVMTKDGESAKNKQSCNSNAFDTLSRMDLEQAKQFLRLSEEETLPSQLSVEFNGGSSSAESKRRVTSFPDFETGPSLKRHRSAPNNMGNQQQQQEPDSLENIFMSSMRRTGGSLSELDRMRSTGNNGYSNTVSHTGTYTGMYAERQHLLPRPLTNGPVVEGVSGVNQVVARMDHLKDDDSALQRLIDSILQGSSRS